MTGKRTSGTAAGERGSALLIVFVFAAIIAISLYRELPISVFEAKREKEQLLMDRGNEYVRAVQLYYRKNRGQFPSSIEQLEKTNNIRFLRHRYKDPFTGKDDWRLLHAGPNGILVDSKVNRAGLNGVPGAMGANGSGTGFSNGSNANGFANSSSPSGMVNDDTGSDGTSVPRAPVRGPAIAATGVGHASASGASGQVPTSAELQQNPDLPLVPSDDASQNGGANASANGVPAGADNGGAGAQQAGVPGRNSVPGQQSNIMQTMNPILGSPTTPGAAGAAQAGALGPQSGFGNNNSSSGSTLGQMNGGGALAGVASKAKGRSIKLLDDQDDYSLWEFHYDPTTDTSMSRGLNTGSGLQGSQPGSTSPANSGTFSNPSGSFGTGTGNSGASTGSFGTPTGISGRRTAAPPPPAADNSGAGDQQQPDDNQNTVPDTAPPQQQPDANAPDTGPEPNPNNPQ